MLAQGSVPSVIMIRSPGASVPIPQVQMLA
jgi:hypothetical protein